MVFEKKRMKAATKIQAFFRSFLSRRHHQDYIEERKLFFELREEEDMTRNSSLYKSLGYLGMQPFLKSDTPKERLHKIYPKYLMNIVEEACDSNWTLAYRLIREQEEFEWKRDADAMHRLRDKHGENSMNDHLSSHAKLMALRQKRLARPEVVKVINCF